MWRVLCVRVLGRAFGRARACVHMRALTTAIDFQQCGADDLVELEMLQRDFSSFKTFEHIPGGGGLSGQVRVRLFHFHVCSSCGSNGEWGSVLADGESPGNRAGSIRAITKLVINEQATLIPT